MTIESAPRTRFHGIQALRAIAAFLVVIFHSAVTVGGSSMPVGQIGVDIFFVISGFIMVQTALAKPQGWPSVSTFLGDRLRRIVPMYWLVTIGMLILMLAIPQAFGTNRIDWMHAAASFAFLPAVNQFTGADSPVLFVGWSLNIEMWFYAIFALGLFLPERWRLPWIGAVIVVCVVLGQVAGTGLVADTYGSPMMIEFLAGCLVGWVSLRWKHGSLALGWTVIGTGVLLTLATVPLEVDPLSRVWLWGIPSVLLVSGTVLIERAGAQVPAPLASLGGSSYSLYLIHPIILAALGKTLPENWPMAILASVICVVVAHCVFLMIERPIDERLKHLFSRRKHRAVIGPESLEQK